MEKQIRWEYSIPAVLERLGILPELENEDLDAESEDGYDELILEEGQNYCCRWANQKISFGDNATNSSYES